MNTIRTYEQWNNFNCYQTIYIGPPSEVLIALQDAKDDILSVWDRLKQLERMINEQNLHLQNQR